MINLNEYLDPAAFSYTDSGMSLFTVAQNQVLSKGDQREVRHIEFDWSGETYDPGDVAMVQPQMPAHDRHGILHMISFHFLHSSNRQRCTAHHVGSRSRHNGGSQNFKSSRQISAYSRTSFIIASHSDMS